MTDHYTKRDLSPPEKGTDIISVNCPDCGIARIGMRGQLARSVRCRPCASKNRWTALGKVPENKKARKKASKKKYYRSDKYKETAQFYYENNRAKIHSDRCDWREKLRVSVLTSLGGRCVGCGVEDYEVLHIDHVHDDGAADRKRIPSYAVFLRKLLKCEIDRSRYQILCCNCNWRKELRRRRKRIRVGYDLV